MASSKL